VSAHGEDLSRLQHPQQQHLHLGGGLAHLVQEQGASMGGAEEAVTLLVGTRVGALARTEELRRGELLGHGAQVDADERPRAAGAGLVNGLGDQLLARARLAADEHRHLQIREHWMVKGENPPVGLILCAEKDHAVAHYAARAALHPRCDASARDEGELRKEGGEQEAELRERLPGLW
jgi:hypothetical protein